MSNGRLYDKTNSLLFQQTHHRLEPSRLKKTTGNVQPQRLSAWCVAAILLDLFVMIYNCDLKSVECGLTLFNHLEEFMTD